jgi:hypothetical protein
MDFFKTYFEYVGPTEAPMLYHRWTAISILGTLLGRQAYIPFGHGTIYPNQYIMLMGSPGTRKGTAMNIGARLLKNAGYTRFCPDRLSKERFLMEMKPYDYIAQDEDGDLSDLENLVVDSPSEIYAFAEEFTDLVGQGGMEFMTMLTKLWDNMPRYEHPKIHGRSIVVEKPTVNIFGGNTAQGFALAVPAEAIGNGFLSRVLFVYSDPTAVKITFPPPVNIELRDQLVSFLKDTKENFKGELTYTQDAIPLLDSIYKNAVEVNDIRFKHYMTRRFPHLLKLCIVVAASESSMQITPSIVIKANTFLASVEKRMPKALGEFGKGKYNEVSGTILDILANATKPMSLNDIYKKVDRDLSKITELADIMKSLTYAEKVQVKTVMGKTGYMSRVAEVKEWPSNLIDESYLTEEERM